MKKEFLIISAVVAATVFNREITTFLASQKKM